MMIRGLAALAITVLLATAADASRVCGARANVVERLASAYGETRQAIGLGANNTLVEVFASSETGSWTITATRSNGLTCLVASGQAFETLSESLPEGEDM